jgi:endonuclease YncB( thermonuclease family)
VPLFRSKPGRKHLPTEVVEATNFLLGPTSQLRGDSTAARPHSASSDGDTFKQGGVTYRLWGIDAPEAKQVCPDGWPAGSLATTRLQALTAGRSIVCQEKDRDRYGRIVAICRANGEDLGAIMVREGACLGVHPVQRRLHPRESRRRLERSCD